MGTRACRACQKLLPTTDFGKNARFSDGLQRICRPCAAEDNVRSRKRKLSGEANAHPNRRPNELARLNELLSKYQQGKGRSTTFAEHQHVALLTTQLADSFEVRVWQDGTKSDIGVRLLGATTDRWYPIQLKGSNVEPVKFELRGKDNALPTHDVVCIAMSRMQSRPGVYFFPVGTIADMNIGSRGILSGFRLDRLKHEGSFMTFDALKVKLADMCARKDAVFTENELRFEVNESMKRELQHMELSNRLRPASVTAWPEQTQDVFDQWRDGEREQFKSAVRDGNSFACPNFSKKLALEKVPYELGDCDWYVIGMVVVGNIYVEWRIPEAALDSWGLLSRRSEDGASFVHAGKTNIQLQLPTELQLQIVGKPIRSDVDCRTAKYVSILKV